jgi:hypothetical protein
MMPPEQLKAVCADELAQCGPSQRSVRDDALVLPMIRDLPGFSPIVARREQFAERSFQPPSSPEVTTQDRLESEWIECGCQKTDVQCSMINGPLPLQPKAVAG